MSLRAYKKGYKNDEKDAKIVSKSYSQDVKVRLQINYDLTWIKKTGTKKTIVNGTEKTIGNTTVEVPGIAFNGNGSYSYYVNVYGAINWDVEVIEGQSSKEFTDVSGMNGKMNTENAFVLIQYPTSSEIETFIYNKYRYISPVNMDYCKNRIYWAIDNLRLITSYVAFRTTASSQNVTSSVGNDIFLEAIIVQGYPKQLEKTIITPDYSVSQPGSIKGVIGQQKGRENVLSSIFVDNKQIENQRMQTQTGIKNKDYKSLLIQEKISDYDIHMTPSTLYGKVNSYRLDLYKELDSLNFQDWTVNPSIFDLSKNKMISFISKINSAERVIDTSVFDKNKPAANAYVQIDNKTSGITLPG